jgi:hypothetical protein
MGYPKPTSPLRAWLAEWMAVNETKHRSGISS